jgi:hypothetical protein
MFDRSLWALKSAEMTLLYGKLYLAGSQSYSLGEDNDRYFERHWDYSIASRPVRCSQAPRRLHLLYRSFDSHACTVRKHAVSLDLGQNVL